MDLKSLMNSEWGKNHIVFASASSAATVPDADPYDKRLAEISEKKAWECTRKEIDLLYRELQQLATHYDMQVRAAQTASNSMIEGRTIEEKTFNMRKKVVNGQTALFKIENLKKNISPLRHKIIIEKALSEGMNVPEKVLQDYPDIAKKSVVPDAEKVASEKKETKGQKLVKDIEQSIAELEKKIDSPETEKTIREWLAFQGQFHSYSLYNSFWLAVQSMIRGTQITQVAGFRKWVEMKGKDGQNVSVNKGEKGYSILYPQIHKLYEKDENGTFKKDENGERIPLLDENGKQEQYITYGTGYVFDVSQTNAVEIGAYKELNHRGEAVKIDPELVQEIAKRITAEFGIPVTFENNQAEQAGGWYIPSEHSITINTAVSKELSHQLGTLFHELGHGLMHGRNAAKYSRSLKEGQAEAFAYACSMQFGVERKSELYIKGWIADEVPLQDVMKDISSNIKDTFEKLKLQELILQQQMQTDVSVSEKQSSENQTAEKKTVTAEKQTAEQQSSEKLSENTVFMLNKVFLLGANTAFSQLSNPRYKELCKACDYIQLMDQSDPRIAELYSVALEGERHNFSNERTGAEILNRVIEYQKMEKRQSEQKADESQMMLF